jgi:hypothetical protein
MALEGLYVPTQASGMRCFRTYGNRLGGPGAKGEVQSTAGLSADGDCVVRAILSRKLASLPWFAAFIEIPRERRRSAPKHSFGNCAAA